MFILYLNERKCIILHGFFGEIGPHNSVLIEKTTRCRPNWKWDLFKKLEKATKCRPDWKWDFKNKKKERKGMVLACHNKDEKRSHVFQFCPILSVNASVRVTKYI